MTKHPAHRALRVAIVGAGIGGLAAARVTLQSRRQFANNRKVPPPPFLDRSWIFSFDVTASL